MRTTRTEIICIKVNWYTMRGSNSVTSIVASLRKWNHLIKERIATIEQILFFRSRPHFAKTSSPGKQTGNYENCLPLKTLRKKEGVPRHLNSECLGKPRYTNDLRKFSTARGTEFVESYPVISHCRVNIESTFLYSPDVGSTSNQCLPAGHT